MTRLKVTNKVGLGRLVLCATTDQALKARLLQNPSAVLSSFIENIPAGHVIKVVAEEQNVSFLVLPSADDIPASVEDKEAILLEEARDYDRAKHQVEESKKKSGSGSIPTDVVEETYALMIGHTALSPSSRPPKKTTPNKRGRKSAA